MYKSKANNRWEATQPEHFVGWRILGISELAGEDEWCMVMVERNDKSKEQRLVYAKPDSVPISAVERNRRGDGR